jgi:GT2 family glycosyltransferase
MIHLILPVHNRVAVTSRFLNALAEQTWRDFRVLLVDDGCSDGTVTAAQTALGADQLKVLSGDGQLWWAGALDLAYRDLQATRPDPADLVLICNDDMALAPDFLATAVRVAAENPGAATQAMGRDILTGVIDCGAVADLRRLRFAAADPDHPANCLSTRGLLMTAAQFLASGGFRPKRLPHYLSDYEFTLRLARQGLKLRCDARWVADVSLELTGQAHYVDTNWRACWAAARSNRAKYNPVHWSTFVCMVCPLWTQPWHLARIWLRCLRALLRAASPVRFRPVDRAAVDRR